MKKAILEALVEAGGKEYADDVAPTREMEYALQELIDTGLVLLHDADDPAEDIIEITAEGLKALSE